MVNPTPAAEIEIDETLVRQLLVEQAPAFAGLPLEVLASGWDNTILKLGSDHLVRLPRRQVAVDLVEHEQRWLPAIAARLPIAVPVPVVLGRPSAAFPWPWSIVDYVAGLDAISERPEQTKAVETLARFFSAMHVDAPDDAPINPWRGGPLAERVDVTAQRFESLDGWLASQTDVSRLRSAWETAVDAEPYAGPPQWIHGDVHPGNLIVRDGEIVSVIDFGDLTSGDPATDLGSAWMLLDQPQRLQLRSVLAVGDDTWNRARGWALSVALAIADSSADNPRYRALSAQTLTRIAVDDI